MFRSAETCSFVKDEVELKEKYYFILSCKCPVDGF